MSTCSSCSVDSSSRACSSTSGVERRGSRCRRSGPDAPAVWFRHCSSFSSQSASTRSSCPTRSTGSASASTASPHSGTSRTGASSRRVRATSISSCPHTPSPLRHTWSLAIEEQFYLVWPVVVVLVGLVVKRLTGDPGRHARRLRRTLLTMCLVLGAASLLRMHALHDAGEDLNRVYYGTDSRAFVILFGAALGALTAGVPTVAHAFRRFVVVVGCCLAVALAVAVAFISAESSWLYEGGYGIVALAMVAVLLAAAQPGSNPLRACSKAARSSASGSSRTACTSGTGRSRSGSPKAERGSTTSHCSSSALPSLWRSRSPATSSWSSRSARESSA